MPLRHPRLILLAGIALALASCGTSRAGWYTPEPPRSPSLVLLPLTAPQQTTDYTCGPCAALAVLHWWRRDGDEMAICTAMGTSQEVGTTPTQMADWLRAQGFTVSAGENGSVADIRARLAVGIPTLVEWSDWGGHWVVAVGYDDRGTADIEDDVIVFADPCDCHDDRKDGRTWFNAQRFDYMWYDALLFGRLMKKVWVVAVPAGTAVPPTTPVASAAAAPAAVAPAP